MPSRLGIDIGGTHTDFLLLNETTGHAHAHKIRTTPNDPSVAIAQGLTELTQDPSVNAAEINDLVQGTTVRVDQILERQAGSVGLLITKDFEQLLHLARSRTPGRSTGSRPGPVTSNLANLTQTRGIVERISARGDVITPLEEAAAYQSITQLFAQGVQSLTICLLHAYANPMHELRLKSIAAEIDRAVPVSLSHELAPQAGEYERTLATVINACVQPQMDNLLSNVQQALKTAQIGGQLTVAQSTGARVSARQAGETPVYAMRAGPAGGAAGAASVATLAGYPDALSFEMGGSSTDICLIRDGVARMANETAVGDDPINLPSLDVRTIGAGSGATAHSPMSGTLCVDSQNRDATPTPACFGGDNNLPTVSDANVVLGRLPGNHVSVDAAAAADVVGALARDLGLDSHRAAQGIVDIVNEQMAGALRLSAIEKGLQPAGLALVAGGGAGPMHGCAIGMVTGCSPVIVPRHAGVLSALGHLGAGFGQQFAQTVAKNIDQLGASGLTELIERLTVRASAWLSQDGAGMANHRIELRADLRYLTSSFQTSVRVEPEKLADGGLDQLADRLAHVHQRRFGLKLEQPVELVTLRAIASAGTSQERSLALPKFETADPNPRAALIEQSQVYFDDGFVSTPIYEREQLAAGNQIIGPALIVQSDATTVIHPGYVAHVDAYLNLLIQRAGAAH